MPAQPITTLFWDVGGVLLNNAWDHNERRTALSRFHVDEAEFTPRHEQIVDAFEKGQVSLDQYLDQTIFFRPRSFSKEEFKDCMLHLSQPMTDSLAFAKELAHSGKYKMATLNNESRELNVYRIEKYGFVEIFSLFVSSCFVAQRKPGEAIYRTALDLTQSAPSQCCFIDDRAENLKAPAQLGMKVIQMEGTEKLRQSLQMIGVTP